MKSLLILPVLAAGALASKVELNNPEVVALFGRAMDPKTMDPTQLYVLSVLKTAIPTGPNAPLPTGDYEPEWYQKLPADVKSLLPLLYPAATTATATDAAKPVSEVVSETPVPSAASSLATPSSLLLPLSTALVSSALLNTTAAVSDTSPVTAAFTLASASAPSSNCTSQTTITLTKTLQYAPPTATAGSNSSTAAGTTGSPNGTLPAASPLPSEFFSAGAKTAIRMETLAAIMWVGVAVGFCVFA